MVPPGTRPGYDASAGASADAEREVVRLQFVASVLLEALKQIADQDRWYGEQRFAEDSDADFLLRVIAAGRTKAREALAKAQAQ